MFDYVGYIKHLTATNVACNVLGFRACTCSGVGNLEELLAGMLDASRFVAVSDVCEESTFSGQGGWFKRRVFTVFILSRYTFGDMESFGVAMAICRDIYRQFLSRILADQEKLANKMLYIDTERVLSRELGGVFLNGTTGLEFQLAMDEPIGLRYDGAEWDEGLAPNTFPEVFDKSFA